MSGFSRMLNMSNQAFKSAIRSNSSILFSKSSAESFLKNTNNQLQMQSRGSHGRTMFIRPGKFYTKKYFDMIHFHLCLSALPFALIIGYQYLFVGPATLTEIPEDYEPRYYEYHRNPVKRFLSKYVYDIPERAYEEHLNFLYKEQCNQKMRLLETKVRNMMKEKQDYKAWYYVPVPKEPMEAKQQYIEKMGGQGYDSKFTK